MEDIAQRYGGWGVLWNLCQVLIRAHNLAKFGPTRADSAKCGATFNHWVG